MGLKIDYADIPRLNGRSEGAGSARKRVTVTWFAHCLREQFELNLIEEGFSPGTAQQLARDTEIRILPGRCQTHPPNDPKARECLESADQKLSSIYSL